MEYVTALLTHSVWLDSKPTALSLCKGRAFHWGGLYIRTGTCWYIGLETLHAQREGQARLFYHCHCLHIYVRRPNSVTSMVMLTSGTCMSRDLRVAKLECRCTWREEGDDDVSIKIQLSYSLVYTGDATKWPVFSCLPSRQWFCFLVQVYCFLQCWRDSLRLTQIIVPDEIHYHDHGFFGVCVYISDHECRFPLQNSMETESWTAKFSPTLITHLFLFSAHQAPNNTSSEEKKDQLRAVLRAHLFLSLFTFSCF